MPLRFQRQMIANARGFRDTEIKGGERFSLPRVTRRRTGFAEEGAWSARPCSDPDRFCRRNLLGRNGGKAWSVANRLLATGDRVILSAGGGCRDLSEQAHAIGRRPLPMGEVWFQRFRRIYGGVESLAARDRGDGGHRARNRYANILYRRTECCLDAG